MPPARPDARDPGRAPAPPPAPRDAAGGDGAAAALSLVIVVPVLDEARVIGATLAALAGWRAQGAQVVVADGGSTDGTIAACTGGADRVLTAPRGRARQMNAGAAAAPRSDWLLFLHADTRLPAQALPELRAAMRAGGRDWGRFDVHIEGRSRWLPVVAAMMNLRSRLTGIATGDQAVFVRRVVFDAVGGFPDQPLMEDIALSARLRRRGPPACLRARVRTSGRRWDERGALRTIVLMWRLRLLYALGASPERLARAYR